MFSSLKVRKKRFLVVNVHYGQLCRRCKPNSIGRSVTYRPLSTMEMRFALCVSTLEGARPRAQWCLETSDKAPDTVLAPRAHDELMSQSAPLVEDGARSAR